MGKAKEITLSKKGLNIIENIWSQMKHEQRREQATSMAGLKKITQKVWKNLKLDYVERLYASLPKWMEAVILVGGGHTKY